MSYVKTNVDYFDEVLFKGESYPLFAMEKYLFATTKNPECKRVGIGNCEFIKGDPEHYLFVTIIVIGVTGTKVDLGV